MIRIHLSAQSLMAYRIFAVEAETPLSVMAPASQKSNSTLQTGPVDQCSSAPPNRSNLPEQFSQPEQSDLPEQFGPPDRFSLPKQSNQPHRFDRPEQLGPPDRFPDDAAVGEHPDGLHCGKAGGAPAHTGIAPLPHTPANKKPGSTSLSLQAAGCR